MFLNMIEQDPYVPISYKQIFLGIKIYPRDEKFSSLGDHYHILLQNKNSQNKLVINKQDDNKM